MTGDLFEFSDGPFELEKELLRTGYVAVAGVDEAGRGALAGRWSRRPSFFLAGPSPDRAGPRFEASLATRPGGALPEIQDLAFRWVWEWWSRMKSTARTSCARH